VDVAPELLPPLLEPELLPPELPDAPPLELFELLELFEPPGLAPLLLEPLPPLEPAFSPLLDPPPPCEPDPASPPLV
jgi:hypothetical protein